MSTGYGRVFALSLAILATMTSSGAWAAPPGAKEHAQRARALSKAGKVDEAIAEYKQAYELARDPILLFNIGLEYRKKGDGQKAIEAFTAYLDAAPKDATSEEARQYVAALRRDLEMKRQGEAAKQAGPAM